MILGYVEYANNVYPYVEKDENGYKIKITDEPNRFDWVGYKQCKEVDEDIFNHNSYFDEIQKNSKEVEEKTEPLNEFEKAVYNICIDLAQTLIKKNRDYGDSYSKLKSEYGDLALIIRQSDKLERLKTLQKQDNLVNESKKDTKLDGAGYYILDLAYEQLKR